MVGGRLWSRRLPRVDTRESEDWRIQPETGYWEAVLKGDLQVEYGLPKPVRVFTIQVPLCAA
jgi:hypothetical protein